MNSSRHSFHENVFLKIILKSSNNIEVGLKVLFFLYMNIYLSWAESLKQVKLFVAQGI